MPAANLKIVTVDQMVAVEQAAPPRGVSLDTLMENAGLAVAQAARSELRTVAGARVLVLTGPGNNGADGLVAARHLRRWGAEVTAYVVTHRPNPDPKMAAALRYDVAVVESAADQDLGQLERLLDGCGLVIDAVLGAGRGRPLTGVTAQVLQRVNARRRESHGPKVLALDLPTGVNPDTGEVDPGGLVADVTITLGFPKVGLLTFPAAGRVGRLEIFDAIGLPENLPEVDAVDLELMTSGWVAAQLPPRPANSHKGIFGHALIIAGSRNYVGAACLAAQAALRVGTGLVTLATPESVYPIAASKLTEAIHLPLPEDSHGRIASRASAVLRSGLSAYSCVAVGSGLGRSPGVARFMENLLGADFPPGLPVIVDADGLNNLSGLPGWWESLPPQAALTPHPGEMSTLTGLPTAEIQRDRVSSARHWSREWGAAVVLKGAYTVIARPPAPGMDELPALVSPFANPGLASGGTGDVLTGIIAGLTAQGLNPGLASACGVYLHGLAGEMVGRRRGDAGILASDLVDALPETIKSLKNP